MSGEMSSTSYVTIGALVVGVLLAPDAQGEVHV